jgi:hypothetical protein
VWKQDFVLKTIRVDSGKDSGSLDHFDAWLDQAFMQKPPSSWVRHAEKAFESNLHPVLPTEAQLRQIAGAFPLPVGQIEQLCDMRGKVLSDSLLTRLFMVWHIVLFIEKDASAESYEPWPLPVTLNESDASLFRALVILSGTVAMERALRERRLSEWQQFCKDEYIHESRMHFELHGVYGLANTSMWWLWPVFLGRVFRLGRLTYEIAFYTSSWKVFRHKEGPLVLLAGDMEQRYDENGLESDVGLFRPTYRETACQVTGNRFNAKGTYEAEPITLDLSDWSQVVRTGDPVVSLHISGGGKLDPDAVKESFVMATRFFARYFPDLPLRLFTCHTWLLNTQLDEFLLPDSNILAFQECFTLALANPHNEVLFSFIFDVQPCPIAQLVPKTEFQKHLLKYVRQGGTLRDGFGVLLIEPDILN